MSKALELWSLPTMPNINVQELINRQPHFVAMCVQYYGWALSESALFMLKEKLDGPTYRAVLKAQSKLFAK